VHLSRGEDGVVYLSHGVIENTVVDETIKSLAIVLHEKHALNKTGFGDVQGVLGWFSADSSSRHCCTR